MLSLLAQIDDLFEADDDSAACLSGVEEFAECFQRRGRDDVGKQVVGKRRDVEIHQ